MELELAVIPIIMSGLIVQERGMMLAGSNCPALSEAGERAAGFGMLMTICALPWLAIGIAVSRFL